MRKEYLTDEEVDFEIERLRHSEDVQLAKIEQRIKMRRRQYLYQLRWYEKRGKELAAKGMTVDNIEELIMGDFAEVDNNCEEWN